MNKLTNATIQIPQIGPKAKAIFICNPNVILNEQVTRRITQLMVLRNLTSRLAIRKK